MNKQFFRTECLLGSGSIDFLKGKNVIVFGLGGVGGSCCEALARSGVGHFTLVDCDCVDITNINRQVIAVMSTVGKDKVEVMADRLNDIDPSISIIKKKIFVTKENIGDFCLENYDYVIDCIDNVTAKIFLCVECQSKKIPLITCCGTGNKTEPTLFRVTDLSLTSVCPLARVLRRELKKHGITHQKVLFSTEEPRKGFFEGDKVFPCSIAFVPPVAGMIIAKEVIFDLLSTKNGTSTTI